MSTTKRQKISGDLSKGLFFAIWISGDLWGSLGISLGIYEDLSDLSRSQLNLVKERKYECVAAQNVYI